VPVEATNDENKQMVMTELLGIHIQHFGNINFQRKNADSRKSTVGFPLSNTYGEKETLRTHY
jgi:predicted nucleotide-binding protein